MPTPLSDSWLSPGWAALALAAGQSILGLWAYARFEPKKTAADLEKERSLRKAEFTEHWNSSILDNAQKRHDEIVSVAGALFVLRTTHHDAVGVLNATMQHILLEQNTQGLEIRNLKEALAALVKGTEQMNQTLLSINSSVGVMTGIWTAHVEEHGGLALSNNRRKGDL